MSKYVHKSKFFYGNEISEYGLKHGYIDYRTLAKCGDMVLCNDITKLFHSSINGEYIEPIQENGWIDNQDEINELRTKFDELVEQYRIEENPQKEKELSKIIDDLGDKINDLEYEQDNQQEIFQYYIIDDNFARILEELTNEIVYYIPILDIYIWGVTHWGTSWDYVLTDIKIDLGDENE